MRELKYALLLLSLGLITVSCHKKAEKVERKPVKVEAITVSPGEGESSREYSGTLQAGAETPLSFTVAGTIMTMTVDVGQKVSKGQVIATIDATSLQNTVRIAQAEEDQALDAQQRMKMLHDAKALPEIKWVDIQAKVHQAQAATAIARRGLEDAVLKSPVSGTVAQKLAQPGQTAMPGVPVVTVLTGNDLVAMISVPENDISAFHEGDHAAVNVKGTEYPARLTEKGVQADPMSRTYAVKYRILNPTGDLLPGMLCDVTLQAPAPKADKMPNVVVPFEAVMLKDDNSRMVWTIKDGKAEPRNVTIGELVNGGVEIVQGLQPGDRVITKGQQNVGQGTQVTLK